MNHHWYQYAERKPDAFELIVRGVFGALAGLLIGLSIALYLWPTSALAICVTLAASAVGCGILAAKVGDPFWRALLSALR